MGLTVSLLKNDAKCNAEKRASSFKHQKRMIGAYAATVAVALPSAIVAEFGDEFETKGGKAIAKGFEQIYKNFEKSKNFLSNQIKPFKELIKNKFLNSDVADIIKSGTKAQKGGLIVAGLALALGTLSMTKTAINARRENKEIDKKYEQKAQELTN